MSLVVLGLVLGMVHAEEGDLVAGVALQRRHGLHVRLGAAPPVQVLVDVEDPHLDLVAPAGQVIGQAGVELSGRLVPEHRSPGPGPSAVEPECPKA